MTTEKKDRKDSSSSDTTANALAKRVDKTLQWLEVSRDQWKQKAKDAKEELKKRTLAVRRAQDDRTELQEALM